MDLREREVWIDEGLNAFVIEPDDVPETDMDSLPHVLLLHGLGGSWRMMAPLARLLVERSPMRVICVDLPGFGDSLGLEDPDLITASAERLRHWLERSQRQWQVVGHSYGGAVASRLALLDASRLTQLVLVCPAGHLQYPWKGRRRWRYPRIEMFRQLAMREAATVLSLPGVRRYTIGYLTAPGKALAQHEAREMIVWAGFAQAPAQAGMALARSDLAGEMARAKESGTVDIELQLIWGEQDRVIPVAHGRWLATQLQCPLTIVQAGHLVPVESPQCIVQLVTNHQLPIK